MVGVLGVGGDFESCWSLPSVPSATKGMFVFMVVAAAAAAAPDGVFERQVLKLFRTLLAVRTYCAACVALFLKTWGWRPRYYK